MASSAVRNKVVFEEIAKKLHVVQEHGYTRDLDQCRNKIKILKKEYRSIKDNNGEAGKLVNSIKNWMRFLGIGQHQFQSVGHRYQ
jgi:hypothetical protein